MIKYRAFVDGFVIAHVDLPDRSQASRLAARQKLSVEKQIPIHYIRLRERKVSVDVK